MKTNSTSAFQISPPDYIDAIINGTKFFIQFQQFTPEVETQIIKIIHKYLEQYELLFYKDTILSITKELINNAIKANLKRLYFLEQNLDINDKTDYRNGMENFKDAIYDAENSDKIDQIKDSSYYVRCTFCANKEKINIKIMNNVPLLEPELEKIKARINKAFRYNDISEAFDDILDDSEGAGLGLIMATMLLKNSGFPKDSFTVSKSATSTLMQVSIPCNLVSKESHIKISEMILAEIKNIPALPGNIKEIRRISRDPESTMKQISETIERDPGITASIIKLSNSAGYITSKRIESIEEALKIVGLRGLNTLLIASGVQDIMQERYKQFESIWTTSQKRALYASLIAKNKIKKKQLADQAYLAAILADIGKIVMLSINSDLFIKLKKIAGIKGINDTSAIEEISLGISHNALGALICSKWNFSDTLTQAIKEYHRPHIAKNNLVPLIYTVYLADSLIEIEKRKLRYEIIDDNVLEYFKLTDKEVFEKFHNSLKELNPKPQ